MNFVPCTSPWNNLQLCVVIWSLIALYFTHTSSLSLSLIHISGFKTFFIQLHSSSLYSLWYSFFVLGSPTSLYPCFPWFFPQCICTLFFCCSHNYVPSTLPSFFLGFLSHNFFYPSIFGAFFLWFLVLRKILSMGFH